MTYVVNMYTAGSHFSNKRKLKLRRNWSMEVRQNPLNLCLFMRVNFFSELFLLKKKKTRTIKTRKIVDQSKFHFQFIPTQTN